MNADAVQLRSTFGKCFSGANADFTGEGTFDFLANETLKAGDWQYRIYEDGVKDKVASNAGDLMKSLEIDGIKIIEKINRKWFTNLQGDNYHLVSSLCAKLLYSGDMSWIGSYYSLTQDQQDNRIPSFLFEVIKGHFDIAKC